MLSFPTVPLPWILSWDEIQGSMHAYLINRSSKHVGPYNAPVWQSQVNNPPQITIPLPNREKVPFSSTTTAILPSSVWRTGRVLFSTLDGKTSNAKHSQNGFSHNSILGQLFWLALGSTHNLKRVGNRGSKTSKRTFVMVYDYYTYLYSLLLGGSVDGTGDYEWCGFGEMESETISSISFCGELCLGVELYSR